LDKFQKWSRKYRSRLIFDAMRAQIPIKDTLHTAAISGHDSPRQQSSEKQG
jgi:hypothetical protein